MFRIPPQQLIDKVFELRALLLAGCEDRQHFELMLGGVNRLLRDSFYGEDCVVDCEDLLQSMADVDSAVAFLERLMGEYRVEEVSST